MIRPYLEVIHMAKNGNLHGLRDMVAELNATQRSIEESTKNIHKFYDQWDQFKDRFDHAIKAGLNNIAAALGAQRAIGPAGADLSPEDRRSVLGGEPSVNQIAERLAKGSYRRIVVVAGAGMSVSAGIPDFRSPKTGLYHNLAQYDLPTPESIFDIGYFKENPEPFYTLAKDLYPGEFEPTLGHSFVSLLAKKGILHRHYTQNIDCLDRLAGVPPIDLVEAHGSFAEASCIECDAEYSTKAIRDVVQARGSKPGVPRCRACGGLVKPRITFFGENLPGRFASLHRKDMETADLVIVIGTSLRVQPVSGLPDKCSSRTPRLLLNRELVGSFDVESEENYRDVWLNGDVDDGVKTLARLAGWSEELAAHHDQVLSRCRGAARRDGPGHSETNDVLDVLSDPFPWPAAESALREVDRAFADGDLGKADVEALRRRIETRDEKLLKAYDEAYKEGDDGMGLRARLVGIAGYQAIFNVKISEQA